VKKYSSITACFFPKVSTVVDVLQLLFVETIKVANVQYSVML
jgi:hypothetical protein